jgi:hypothetical protein
MKINILYRLETLTKKVNWVHEEIKHPDVPF